MEKKKENRSLKNKTIAFLKEAAIIMGIVIVIKVGVVQAYHVPTGSMEKTVMTGDLVLVDNITLGPRTPHWIGIPYTYTGFNIPALKLPGIRDVQQGDIVVVKVPTDDKVPYLKRVVAVGGQTVQVIDKQLYVDGEKQPDEYVIHGDPTMLAKNMRQYGVHPKLGNRDQWGPYRVPEGQVFLMGDNRDFSADSRYFGPVDEDHIIGKARMVTMSWDSDRNAPLWKKIRFKRIGKVLM
jgi:signal peptidase I